MKVGCSCTFAPCLACVVPRRRERARLDAAGDCQRNRRIRAATPAAAPAAGWWRRNRGGRRSPAATAAVSRHTATIAILSDQLPNMTTQQQEFAATHYVGSRSWCWNHPRLARAHPISVLHYHLAMWQSAPRQLHHRRLHCRTTTRSDHARDCSANASGAAWPASADARLMNVRIPGCRVLVRFHRPAERGRRNDGVFWIRLARAAAGRSARATTAPGRHRGPRSVFSERRQTWIAPGTPGLRPDGSLGPRASPDPQHQCVHHH